MTLRPLLMPALLVGLAGCPYVSRGELEDQLAQADEDGDGDCDDNQPLAFPGNTEVAYDGIDNDCENGDLVDVDGDGHDIDTDCDDNDPDVFPAAVDAPYDGINADCRDNHDYDQDGDGYIAAGTDPALVEAYEAAWGAGSVPILGDGDCNDLSKAVNPGVADDPWYDGVDADCDGADDYDADGDGYPLELDCLDQADEALEPGVDPAQVYPGADDTLYDGIDSDCARDDDYDADGDGWVAEGYDADHADYIARLSLAAPAGYGDCDDTDDTIHPTALEQLDGINQDCGGGGLPGDGDAMVMAEGDFVWQGPRRLRGAHVDGVYVLGALADKWNAVDDAAVLLAFDAVDGSDPYPSQPLEVHNQPGEALDDGFHLVGGSELTVATVDARDFNTTSSHLVRYAVDQGALSSVENTRWSFFGGSSLVASLDLGSDDKGATYVWSCREGALQVTEQPAQLSAVAVLDDDPVTCLAEDDPTQATVCDATGCTTWQYAPGSLTEAVEQPRAGELYDDLRRHDDLIIGLSDGVVTVEGLGSVDLGIVDAVAADAVADGAVLYLLVADDAGGLTLHWGPVAAKLQTVALTPPDTPEDVAIALGDDALLLGVQMPDTVAWGFLGR